MIDFKVVLSEDVLRDLAEKRDYLASEAGIAVATNYMNLIESHFSTLALFPHRGTPRDDLRPGLRTISIPRKATIAYVVSGRQVVVLHVIFRGQDIGRLFA